MVDHGLALRPVGAGVEGGGDIVGEEAGLAASSLVDAPFRVNDGAHEALDFAEGSTVELRVDAGNPSGLRVGVDLLDVL